MNESKALAPIRSGSEVPQYCSFVPETQAAKTELYNALNAPEVRIADHINKTIRLRDFVVEPVPVINEKTGETEIAPRIVLIDTDGHTYHGVSSGIYNALVRLCMIFGAPTYKDGIPIMIKQINRDTNRIFTFEVVTK